MIKKLILLSVIILNLITLNVNAYSISNVFENYQKYENDYRKSINFANFDKERLEKIKEIINKKIINLEENSKISDRNKEILFWKMFALLNIINDELSNKIVITIINDRRCTNCQTEQLINQLKLTPFLTSAKFIEKDFSDNWVDSYLKDNSISILPAIILSTNEINDWDKMKPYLKELKDKQFSLEVWATFDPYAKRSDRWFLVLEKNEIEKIKSNSYLQWNKDAKITWLEYSDLECPFCAKLHNSDVSDLIKENYVDLVNKYFNHYPLEFHKNAFSWAMILECLWEQKWAEEFYSLIETVYNNNNSEKEFLIDEAVKLWANKSDLEKCVNDNKYSEKINSEQEVWLSLFNIIWTPASILIDNDTGEYEVISWAYPFDSFKKVIDSLLNK